MFGLYPHVPGRLLAPQLPGQHVPVLARHPPLYAFGLLDGIEQFRIVVFRIVAKSSPSRCRDTLHPIDSIGQTSCRGGV
jgi:hypothetical protein